MIINQWSNRYFLFSKSIPISPFNYRSLSCRAKSRQTKRKSIDRQLDREKKRGGNASRISTNEKWVPCSTLIFLSPLLFLLSFFLFLAKHDPAQRFVELYAMTYNLDTISHAISMQSRKGVPFCKWFHLDEEFIG